MKYHQIILYKLYTNKNPPHDIQIYTCYEEYTQKIIDVFVNHGNHYSSLNFKEMLKNYNTWFNQWFEFYKFIRVHSEWLDIFKAFMLDKYIDLRIPNKPSEYSEDYCFVCHRKYGRDDGMLKDGIINYGFEGGCPHYFCVDCLQDMHDEENFDCPICHYDLQDFITSQY